MHPQRYANWYKHLYNNQWHTWTSSILWPCSGSLKRQKTEIPFCSIQSALDKLCKKEQHHVCIFTMGSSVLAYTSAIKHLKNQLYEFPHDKTNKMACAPSKHSDQTGRIRVFAGRMKKTLVLSYPLSAQRRLWSDWADAQADLSLRWAHMPFGWFCHEAAHISLILTVVMKLIWS